MARPFIIIGSVIFGMLMLLTFIPLSHLPAIIIVSAILTLVFLILGIRFCVLRIQFFVFLAVFLASLSFTVKTNISYIPAAEVATSEKAIVTGIVTDVSHYKDSYYYTLDNIVINSGKATKHKIQITYKEPVNVKIDDAMCFAVNSINTRTSDEAFFMPDEDGVYLYAYSECEPLVYKAQSHTIKYYLSELRLSIRNKISNATDENCSGALNAMLTGDKTLLNEDTKRSFSHSGISHLFAVSGFHLSLWTALIFVVFDRINKKMQIIGNIIATVFVLFFMALTGFTPSVVRAGIMLFVYILGKLTKHKADSMNSLFVALTIILLINPYCATSTSLLMSFLATFGIIAFSESVTEPVINLKKKIKVKFIYKIILTLYSAAAISVVATIFISPVSAVQFGYYSVLSPITNLLCLPVAQLILPLSCIGFATSSIQLVSDFFFSVCNLIMKYVIFVSDKISSVSFSTVNANSDTVQIVLVMILLILLLLTAVFERKTKILRIIAVSSLALFTAVSSSVLLYEKNSVTFYVAPVSNGTAVVCNIHGRKMILGCGGAEYKEYQLTNITDMITYKDMDLLLIPLDTKTESGYTADLLSKYSFGKIAVCEDFYSENVSFEGEDVYEGNMLKITIDENSVLVYINTDTFCGARIESDDFRCTMIFKADSDFSQMPVSWQEGNLLITRDNSPETSLNFGHTVISAYSYEADESDSTYATTDSGRIIYTYNQHTGAEINADY